MSELGLGEKTGIQAAVAELHDPAAVSGVSAEQLPLLPSDQKQAEGGKNHAENGVTPRGAGRPPGAKNRSTEEWKQFILSQHRSPLLVLAEVATCTIQELAVKLGHDPANKVTFDKAVDLLKIQLGCAKELAPYVHQKQPLAIDGSGGSLMSLFIGSLPNQQPVENGEFTDITVLDFSDDENQQVSGNSSQESNETKSNESAVAEENRHASQVSAGDLESATGGAL